MGLEKKTKKVKIKKTKPEQELDGRGLLMCKRKRFFQSRFFIALVIPVLYVFTSFVLDMVMYINLGWAFPRMYLFSLLLMVLFAFVISIIPSRIAQISIFTLFLIARAVAIVGNVVALGSLGELFILESLRGITEIAEHGSSEYIPFLLTALVVIIVAVFLITSIVIHKKFRKRKYKAGYEYSWRGAAACMVAVLVMFTAVSGSFMNMAPLDDREQDFFINNLNNDRFVLSTFLNRHMFMQSFGPTMFYTMNLLDILRIRPSFGMTVPYAEGSWNELDAHPFELDENFNLIMLMMETVEFDAINPLVTPNIWRLKSMSTWVDGYHAFERTVMTEYVSLTGGHTLGQEMWFSYTENNVPSSLPNIFRRSGYDQMGAFHNNWRTHFRRDPKFVSMGFDFYHTPEDYLEDSIAGTTNQNSDFLMIDLALYDIAPVDRTFMSYVLTVSPHHSVNLHLINRYENRQPVFADLPYPHNNRRAFTTSINRHTENFLPDIEAIAKMEYYLAQFFPKLAIGTDFERMAAFQYLVKVHNLDRGVGRLIEHLETTPDFRYSCGTVMMIDRTALVLYSDHFGHSWYGHRNNPGGGKLSNTRVNRALGEQLAFIVYNPTETSLRQNALPLGWRWDSNDVTDFFSARPFNPVIYNHDPGTRVIPPLEDIGRRIVRYMANIDIFPTVAHMFGIQTHTNITLGVSIFEEDNFSIGVGFITGGIFTGRCFDSNELWATRDLVTFNASPNIRNTFQNSARTTRPSEETIGAAMQRINQMMHTMHMLRVFHGENSFPYYAYYIIGGRPINTN